MRKHEAFDKLCELKPIAITVTEPKGATRICIEDETRALEKALLAVKIARALKISGITTVRSELRFTQRYGEVVLVVPEELYGCSSDGINYEKLTQRLQTLISKWKEAKAALQDEIPDEVSDMIYELTNSS